VRGAAGGDDFAHFARRLGEFAVHRVNELERRNLTQGPSWLVATRGPILQKE
jgi:hypothetical protein